MELLDVLEKRCSVRHFKDEPVPVDDLKEMIRRAALAPSVNNSQQWKFLVVTNADKLRQMGELVERKIDLMFPDGDQNTIQTVKHFSTVFARSPATVFVLTQPYRALAERMVSPELVAADLNAQRKFPNYQSAAAAVQNFLLSAVDMGYGACWLSGLMVAEDALKESLKIEEPWEMVTAIAVGKPERQCDPKPRQPFDEIFELID